MNSFRTLAPLVVAGCALAVLSAAPAAADPQISSNRVEDSHPLPADRADDEAEDDDHPYYMNCVHARSESHTPLFAGQPGYSFRLDADGDGLACEVGEY
ncbi:excalibur calcium-binding domain-containing protein [Nocardia flavorosea]|uniref:Excalibur calcium-binding domain-containing protein n=1 Tax=Nocardia flavorosea TaxID=53429 RepID=A0A846YC06_9NOCA|nr:excalibur calcium-binding domain-containing protein [Nocardia flavorosea]NKY56387.1 excalibur calcium-binding domain-containing protein [Nocardia flavorosea]